MSTEARQLAHKPRGAGSIGNGADGGWPRQNHTLGEILALATYMSTDASQHLKPEGLFLLAPAFYLSGYVQQNLVHNAKQICAVHGWRDNVVPTVNRIRFAKRHHGDHRLNSALSKIEPIFESFLTVNGWR